MLIINLSILFQITNPSKPSTCNSIQVSKKNFSIIALMVYPVGVTEYCEKYFALSQIICSNMLQILSNFIEIKSNTSIIFVPNLKEIEIREHNFKFFKFSIAFL